MSLRRNQGSPLSSRRSSVAGTRSPTTAQPRGTRAPGNLPLSFDAESILRLQSVLGNTGVQRLLVQRAPEDDLQTMEEIVNSMGEPGAAPPPETLISVIMRESPDAGLGLYKRATARERIRSAYQEGDARRVLGALLRRPYEPGAQSILYQYLDPPEKDEVNEKTNRRFAEETGITGSLDWSKTADRLFARRWMMLRDDAMDERAAAEIAEEEKKLRAELLAKAATPADLHTELKGLDAATQASLLRDTAFKKDLRNALSDWDEFAESIEDLGGRAMSADLLLENRTVKNAINDAWKDSLPTMPVAKNRDEIGTRNHEEGGWVYMNLVTSKVVIRRETAEDNTFISLDPTGEVDEIWISLDHPPKVEDSVLVAVFHVHPNQSRFASPSGPDGDSVTRRGVPGLIRTSSGTGWFGPHEQRASLRGHQTWPS